MNKIRIRKRPSRHDVLAASTRRLKRLRSVTLLELPAYDLDIFGRGRHSKSNQVAPHPCVDLREPLAATAALPRAHSGARCICCSILAGAIALTGNGLESRAHQ